MCAIVVALIYLFHFYQCINIVQDFANKDWGIPGSTDTDLLPECQKVRKPRNCSEPLKNWKTVTIQDTIES